jgi:hypothetical protein
LCDLFSLCNISDEALIEYVKVCELAKRSRFATVGWPLRRCASEDREVDLVSINLGKRSEREILVVKRDAL